MSAGATRAGAPAAASGAGADPWLIAVLVAVAVFMEVLDTTIANVALRYIAGGLGVSEDEASWVVTTYLVANATIVMATSFVSKWFGRKAVFLTCLGLFTLNSVLCGMAGDLHSLLLFRILQGFAGGGIRAARFSKRSSRPSLGLASKCRRRRRCSPIWTFSGS
jgi:DHA2 family multidrug resistance protein